MARSSPSCAWRSGRSGSSSRSLSLRKKSAPAARPASRPTRTTAVYTTSSIYLASAGFFAFIVLISAALLLVR